MIKTLPEPCWVIEPNTSGHDDVGEMHFLDVDVAARSLASHVADVGSEDGPEEAEKARQRHAIIQKPEACRQVACDGCGDVFEDDEDGVSHAVTEDDVEGLLRIAVWCDWQRGRSGAIYCTKCAVPDPLPPGPGPDDVPLPLEGLETA